MFGPAGGVSQWLKRTENPTPIAQHEHGPTPAPAAWKKTHLPLCFLHGFPEIQTGGAAEGVIALLGQSPGA